VSAFAYENLLDPQCIWIAGKVGIVSHIPAEKPKKMREIVVKSGLWISPGKFDFSSG
jgi:hypothetical protein